MLIHRNRLSLTFARRFVRGPLVPDLNHCMSIGSRATTSSFEGD